MRSNSLLVKHSEISLRKTARVTEAGRGGFRRERKQLAHREAMGPQRWTSSQCMEQSRTGPTESWSQELLSHLPEPVSICDQWRTDTAAGLGTKCDVRGACLQYDVPLLSVLFLSIFFKCPELWKWKNEHP